ncbi:phenylalanine--tRNA ligase subunit beta [Rhodopila sp.]|jgi:phenylalanyl-tRNA synthetase beta chain|uniref:phenylalanine--tRNA ligase subunit beta n=1 Tax=Rhodopila sp. TaxID=2480087 RepID=UPI002CB8CE2A|nr:phenylalanine--tRNA ligase subunit beta [Rhodopila sp.]HVZ06844.1 phenylalanine--tRNA ligase subunit beta [Rhodopila sp.]
MKFTLSWLKTHLDTDAPLERITDTLTQIGLELEGVEDRGAALAPFVVAHVIEALPHPNADRLRACKVDTGSGIVSVVCGAPNARSGMKGVFAPPGSFIPGTGMTLKIGEIRGVQSAGMLLSSKEMGLGDDHSGIVELPESAPVGQPYTAWSGLDDPVIEVSVTPNRGDCFSVRGIARDLAAAGIGTLKPLAAEVIPPRFDGGPTWRIDFPEACPWILGRTIRGVKNSPSPKWLQDRLTSIGLRPINALVDVTNFFTFDLGRPLHVFDVARLTGDVLTLRRGAGETLRALNGKDYVLDAEDCAICDAAGVQSIAGVIGGEATGCDEATTTVFIECALFDPVRIALTGRRHQIVSDARQRFERGLDPALMPAAIEAATALIQELCGGEPGAVTAAGAEPAWQREATMRFDRVRTFGGSDIPPDEAAASLERLGFLPRRRTAEAITVAVPSWRNDVAARILLDQSPSLDPAKAAKAAEGCAAVESENDLIEEVLRLRGLDAVPPVSLPRAGPVPPATLTPRQQRSALARRTLAAAGLLECVTFSFMARDEAARFGTAPESLRLLNPIAADLDQLRPTPVATLALSARRNAARGYGDVALFEIGPAFAEDAPDGQKLVAAGLRAGATPRNWLAPTRPVDAMDAKADFWAVLTAVGVPLDALQISADAPPFLHPGRSATVRQGPKLVLGWFGELHPRLLATLDLPAPMVAFELNLDAVADPKRRRKGAPDLPAFQPVRRDFAFVVDAAVPADNLVRAAKGADRALITAVALFDVYEGDQMAAGKKSLGIEVTFQPRERTLTDAEIETACQKVVAAVAKATGALLR